MFAGVNGRGDTSEGGRLGEKGLSKRGGAAAAGVSASSSDTSPDRLSSTSTLKSGSNPPSLSTPQSSSRSTIESPSRTTVLSYGGDTYAQGSSSYFVFLLASKSSLDLYEAIVLCTVGKLLIRLNAT